MEKWVQLRVLFVFQTENKRSRRAADALPPNEEEELEELRAQKVQLQSNLEKAKKVCRELFENFGLYFGSETPGGVQMRMRSAHVTGTSSEARVWGVSCERVM